MDKSLYGKLQIVFVAAKKTMLLVTVLAVRMFTVNRNYRLGPAVLVAAQLTSLACDELGSRPQDKISTKAVFIRVAQIAVLSASAFVSAFPDSINRVIYSGNGNIILAFAGVLLVLLPLALMTAEAGYWWESVRKYLFFNKVVNPFNYEFLLTFDAKNELLKYVGTLREMDKKAHFKWWLLLMALPFCAASVVACAVCGLVAALLGRVILAFAIFCLGVIYNIVVYSILLLTQLKSAVKFYGKKE